VPHCSVSLERGSQTVIGEADAVMLRAIKRSGSFTEAARSLGVSYAHLWNSISQIEQALDAKVVKAERGGARGGRANLTEEGSQLLQQYAKLESQVARVVTGKITQEFPLRAEPSLSFVGSHCVVVEQLLQTLHSRHAEMTYRMVNVGSLGGLTTMMLRGADIAGIHIFDEETQSYNLPLLSRYSLSSTCVLVGGYTRQQCLMVRRGNPKKVKGIADLLRGNVKLANRNLGSGTRILLDHKLRELARAEDIQFDNLTKRIRGYRMELVTHHQVARAVVSRRADVGVGLTSVASNMGLTAIPLAAENYDFVVERRRRRPYVGEFISLLSSKEFQTHIKTLMQGISFTSQTGKILL
jgi:molybdate transport repressor ModE-like protein